MCFFFFFLRFFDLFGGFLGRSQRFLEFHFVSLRASLNRKELWFSFTNSLRIIEIPDICSALLGIFLGFRLQNSLNVKTVSAKPRLHNTAETFICLEKWRSDSYLMGVNIEYCRSYQVHRSRSVRRRQLAGTGDARSRRSTRRRSAGISLLSLQTQSRRYGPTFFRNCSRYQWCNVD